MNPHYEFVALRASHRCEYCHAPEVIFNFPFEVEHVIPVSRQGQDDETNWALACRSCNVRKAAHAHGVDPEGRAEVHLFNPRTDQWEEHFRVEIDSGRIAGLSAIGLATIARLDMNHPAQVAARRQWMRLGLFP